MSIRLYIGCMFSGKTTELLREYTRWKNINKNVIMINYINDDRYGQDDFVYSHDKNKVPCIRLKNLSEAPIELLEKNDVILINEGQFFPDLIEFCKLWCDVYKKNIVVCGLDGDHLRIPFVEISSLISIADEVIKLQAFCKKCNDGTRAIFTKRLSEEKERIVIGSDKYIPVCRKHYLE